MAKLRVWLPFEYMNRVYYHLPRVYRYAGKTSTEEDDVGMSLLMNVYWSFCVRATAGLQGSVVY